MTPEEEKTLGYADLIRNNRNEHVDQWSDLDGAMAIMVCHAYASLIKEVERRRDFPFEYQGGGYWRKNGVPKGEPAPVLHGDQVLQWLRGEMEV